MLLITQDQLKFMQTHIYHILYTQKFPMADAASIKRVAEIKKI